MRRIFKSIAFALFLAASIGLSTTSSARAALCAPASGEEMRAAVDRLNAQGLDVFRHVSMTDYRTFAFSPLLHWYASYLARSDQRVACSREHQADLALLSALESMPGRYFGSRVFSTQPLRGIVVFGQNATLDDPSFASFTPTMLPSFNDMRGNVGVRLDSTKGGLSLYLFDGSPGIVPSTIQTLQTQFNPAGWRAIETQFQRKRVSRGSSYLFLDGASLIRWPFGLGTERVDLGLDSTAVHVFATIDINDTTAHKTSVERISGRMEPWAQKLWVLVDSRTEAIVEIGANIQETEP